MMMTAPLIEPVCPVQVDPLEFFGLLTWIDGRPLLDVMEAYRQTILREALFTFREDGAPHYRRVLTGRGKKNSKTTDAVLAALYKCLVWQSAGAKQNQCYYVASDLAQANDDLELTKLLIRRNPVLSAELTLKANIVERKDGQGFIEILPARDAVGLHGKTYLFLVVDEFHAQRTYDLLMALEIDRTRADAVQWFASYASLYRHAGNPLVDVLKQHEAGTDPRLYVSWYSGTIAEANPSLSGPLGPTVEDVEDAQRSLPSWIFRRLYLNQPGQPDCAAFDADAIESCIVAGRTILPPQPGVGHVAGCDLSGGGADDATLGIAHHRHGVAVLDCLADQGARVNKTFSPEETVKRFAEVLKSYGLSRVTGDRYAAQWPVEAFRKHGITYQPAELNRSQIYAAFEPLLNSGRVELLDHPKLLQQFIGLVRKGEKIDHSSGEHDDHSNAAALACVLAAASPQQARMIKMTGW
jgi:Phage Terminase